MLSFDFISPNAVQPLDEKLFYSTNAQKCQLKMKDKFVYTQANDRREKRARKKQQTKIVVHVWFVRGCVKTIFEFVCRKKKKRSNEKFIDSDAKRWFYVILYVFFPSLGFFCCLLCALQSINKYSKRCVFEFSISHKQQINSHGQQRYTYHTSYTHSSCEQWNARGDDVFFFSSKRM